MSEEITVLASNTTTSIIEENIKIDANKTIKINDTEKSNQIDSIKPIVHPVPVGPYFYPAPWSPYFFRAGPYEPYYHPYLTPVVPSLFRSASPVIPAEDLERYPFPVDDQLSPADALKELEAIRKELSEDSAARQHENRLLFPSISLDPINSSVTVSVKSFASLLRSFSSRVTVTLATKTILVPSISVIS